MATLVFQAVGSSIGGPLGGAIGAFVGNQVDRTIFGGGSREGPRLKELAVTTSSYGQPIPRHFGRMRVAGTIIWSTDLIESSIKQGSKGQPSTNVYSYSASFAVALCSTQISRVGRIWADGELLRGVEGDLKVGGEVRFYLGTGDNPVDPIIAADKGEHAPAFRDCAYAVFEGLQLADFGNRLPAMTFEIFVDETDTVSLEQLVPSSINFSGNSVLQDMLGFSDEGGALSGSLGAIDRIIPLDCVTTKEGLVLDSTTAIPEEPIELPDQIVSSQAGETNGNFKQRSETPDHNMWALRYYDNQRDYQPSVQRALGQRPAGRETVVDLPATMAANGARKLANANAQRARWLKEKLIWRVGELDPRIAPGSVVKVPSNSGYWKVRSWEWFDRGIDLTLERVAPVLNGETRADAGVSNTPSDELIPETLLYVTELPPHQSSDKDRPLIYAAASADGAAWQGANLFVEQGASLVDIGSTGREKATVGTLLSNLEPSACQLVEAATYIDLELVSEDLSFSSTDITGLAMGDNRLIVGGEVLQFLQAHPIGGSQWRLTGLLRGRAGTEDAAQIEHPAGTAVILIDAGLTELDPISVPSSSTSRIAAIGLGDDEATYAPLTNAGLSRRPPMPVWPRVTFKADGGLHACWSRRARGEWRWSEAGEVPLVEELEQYLIGFGPTESPFTAWTSSSPQFEISNLELGDLVYRFGNNELWVKQLGTYSRSNALYLAEIV